MWSKSPQQRPFASPSAPNRSSHPGDDYTVDTVLLERDNGMEHDTYIVLPQFQHLVSSELRRVRLFTAINKHGTVFLWPAKLPDADNDRLRRMANSTLRGAEQAKSLWTKLIWNRDLGAYDLFKAKADLGDPQWPVGRTFRDLIKLAFEASVIDRADHPVIRELNGEM